VAERFFCPDLPGDGRITLHGDEARHLCRVRRLGVGTAVEVFDGHGFATRAVVRAIAGDSVVLDVVGEPLRDRAAACRLTLAAAVPKGERFDWLVEKVTELGVDRLVPLVTERSVVDPRATKLQRLRRVIVEAAKQCGRNRLMELSPPRTWSQWLAEAADGSPRFVAHPGAPPLVTLPLTGLCRGGTARMAIGPEGGFTDSEIETARTAGCRVVGLGATYLRVETAALVASAVLLALCEGTEG
jgi:16S rRNA (uracil1498-N3)-methyltransferase